MKKGNNVGEGFISNGNERVEKDWKIYLYIVLLELFYMGYNVYFREFELLKLI